MEKFTLIFTAEVLSVIIMFDAAVCRMTITSSVHHLTALDATAVASVPLWLNIYMMF